MKKKLLVILGAGSSIPLGMPSVAALNECMKQWGKEWASEHGFPDYFDALWDSVEMYYKSGPSGLRPVRNFERVLGDMVALAHWMAPAPWGDTLRQVASGEGVPPQLQFAYQTEKYGPTITVMDQLSHLLGKLAQHMRLLCVKAHCAGVEALRYQTVINTLQKAFELGIYNLNYDTSALVAWPDAYTGFGDTGVFEPALVHDQKGKWNFVYHLHGSVHHSLTRRLGNEICWRRNLLDIDSFFDTQEGQWSEKLLGRTLISDNDIDCWRI